jgi:hypothetical protein
MANIENKENVKRGREHYSHAKLDAKWAKLRKQAEDRQEVHDKLATLLKIAKAKSRRGESKREIVRLEKRLVAEKEAAKKAAAEKDAKPVEKKELPKGKKVVK